MDKNTISFQLTIFTKLDIERAKSITLSFNANYNKISLPTSINQPTLFSITAKDQTEQINISTERIDYFYRNYNPSYISKFVDFVVNNKDKIGDITRIALNYSYFINDETGKQKNKLNNYHNFFKVYGDAEEIYFRLNNPKIIDGLLFNIITECQSNIVQNSQTFENIKCIVCHYDINNIATQKIDIDSIPSFFNKMNEELESLIKKTEGTLNE